MQFKPGAFIPGAPVQPVLIRYHVPQHMVDNLVLQSLDLKSLGHSDLDMGPASWHNVRDLVNSCTAHYKS